MTQDLASLLPSNATAQERALELATRVRDQLHTGVDATLSFKETPPESALLWLVWEYGLEELLPYLGDPRQVIATGLLWQRIRGTPESLHVALAWLGLDSLVEEEETGSAHWFEYQLDPGRIPSRAELRNMVGLARLSAPVGTRLARIFHGYDMRRFRWDRDRWSNGALWSNYSGVYDPELDAYLSFGEFWKTAAALGEVQTPAATTVEIAAVARYVDRPLWDVFRWGEGAPVRNYRANVAVEIADFGSAQVSQSQADFKATTQDLNFELYSWSDAVTWSDARSWGDPAPMSELGE